MRPARWLSALALVIVVGAPASASHGGIHPTFSTRTTYFHCNGQTKLYQANWFAEGTASTSYVPWDTTPPPGSVSDGNGCGGLDTGGGTNELGDPVFQGTFTGNIRDMTVRIHDLATANARQGATQRLKVYAEIDGVPLFPVGSTEGGYEGRILTVTPERRNSGATDYYEFTITNIGYATEIRDQNGNLIDVETGGGALEDGDGTTEHTVRLLLGLANGIAGEHPHGSNLWVWDTTEVPSGITFNPQSPSAATVAADLPDLG